MRWFYKLGYDYFIKKEEKRALSIFKVLVNLNGLVFDYRVAEALALKALGEDEKALGAFAFASLLKPNSPLPHYHSALLHLKNGRAGRTKLELEKLETSTVRRLLRR